jgi:hypothetical protein
VFAEFLASAEIKMPSAHGVLRFVKYALLWVPTALLGVCAKSKQAQALLEHLKFIDAFCRFCTVARLYMFCEDGRILTHHNFG